MTGSLTMRERAVRVVLGLSLGFIAFNVGLTGQGTEATTVAWGAMVLALVALGSAITGAVGPLAQVGLNQDWSVAYLAARLYVGWEFLYAGWDKASNSWYSGAGAGEVKGILTGAVAGSHATATDPFPPSPHWFGWLANNALASHSELISYLVVTGELCIGIGLVVGLFLRLSAFFGITFNALFMFAGALGAGLNPEMVVLGTIVVLGIAPSVYALSVDRYLLPRVRTITFHVPHIGPHAPAH
jgi:thiosulfate dehydrogenase (quinone) large subunit